MPEGLCRGYAAHLNCRLAGRRGGRTDAPAIPSTTPPPARRHGLRSRGSQAELLLEHPRPPRAGLAWPARCAASQLDAILNGVLPRAPRGLEAAAVAGSAPAAPAPPLVLSPSQLPRPEKAAAMSTAAGPARLRTGDGPVSSHSSRAPRNHQARSHGSAAPRAGGWLGAGRGRRRVAAQGSRFEASD
eukprot:SAG22_NODE_1926_length_3298_cov_2.512660_2_plen_187_part_00